MSVLPSLADVAQAAGVSIGTVSQVLSRNDPRYSQATRERVQASARKLGYHAHTNIDARRLVGRRTGRPPALRNIGFYWHPPEGSPLRNPFYQLLLEGALDACRAAGQILSIVSLDESRPEGTLLLRQLDGLIMLTTGNPAAIAADNMGKPVVTVFQDDPRFTDLGIDEHAAVALVFDHLVARGHRRIGYVGAAAAGGTAGRRYEGFMRALRRAGRRPDARRVALSTGLVSYRTEGAHLFHTLWSACPSAARPTAIMAHNDSMALGVIDAARETGLRVPEDLSVTGLDGTDEGRDIGLTLTTVDVGIRQFGSKAVELIEAGARTGRCPAERIAMPVRLRPGATVARPRAQVSGRLVCVVEKSGCVERRSGRRGGK